MITEGDSWPGIFEEAIIALWNTPTTTKMTPMVVDQYSSQNVSQKIGTTVVKNLNNLTSRFCLKFVGNIIQNIKLAASYLSIMTLVSFSHSFIEKNLTLVLQGVIDIPNNKDFDKKLTECLKRTMYAGS